MSTIAEILARAKACRDAGQTHEAEQLYRQAILQAARENRAQTYYNLGVALMSHGRLDEAAICYAETLTRDPADVEAYNNLGLVLMQQDKLAEAADCFRQALQLRPELVVAHNNLGSVLLRQSRLDEAEACFRRAIARQPDYREAHSNLAYTLLLANQLDEALACNHRALALAPERAEAHHNLAYVLMRQNRLDEALACYGRALELKTDYVDARFNRAVTLLLAGRFAEGWPEYEWRFRRQGQQEEALPQPRWDGSPLANRTLLLRCEQGLGDAIQFIRYAERVKQRVGRVIVECQPSLARLLATAAGVDGVVAKGQSLPAFDVHVGLLSLPGVFGASLENIPAQIPYLYADAQSFARWNEELNADRASQARPFKIGIAWQGSPGNPSDRFRSIPLERFAGIAQTRGVRLYSLQMGPGREQLAQSAGDWPITDLGDRLGDFYDTAAIVRNLDLVISCDSAPRTWPAHWECRCGSRCHFAPIGAGCWSVPTAPGIQRCGCFANSAPAIGKACFGVFGTRWPKSSEHLSENRLGEGDSPIFLRRLRKIGTVPNGSRIGL